MSKESRKDFGGLRALSGVSFNVREKEIVGIIGPNGAGKTTLFNVISGIFKPTFGVLRLDGKSLSTIDHTDLRDGHRKDVPDCETLSRIHGFTKCSRRSSCSEGRTESKQSGSTKKRPPNCLAFVGLRWKGKRPGKQLESGGT